MNKTYIKIPFGEIQYGHLSGRIDVWFRGKLRNVRRPRCETPGCRCHTRKGL